MMEVDWKPRVVEIISDLGSFSLTLYKRAHVAVNNLGSEVVEVTDFEGAGA